MPGFLLSLGVSIHLSHSIPFKIFCIFWLNQDLDNECLSSSKTLVIIFLIG